MISLPNISISKIAFKLKPKAEKFVKQGHPWVFESSVLKQNKEGQPGDLAIIFDQRKNDFLACGLYDPTSPILIKILHTKKGTPINEDWFSNAINRAYSLRIPLLETDTNSYRLINGENDSLPGFIADVYDDILVVKLYSPIWFPYLNEILPLLMEVSGSETLILRLSRRLQGFGNQFGLHDGQVLHGTLTSETIVFREHGVLFSANVIKGHKTGYFLDHRENRRKVGLLAKEKTVLDVFSYAGGFSVHALAHNATSVTSIDISAQALEIAKKNVELNASTGEHITMAIDAFDGLQTLIDENKKFDIVVIDPPSFAKKETEIPRALKSYERLAKLGSKLVSTNGILVLASCSARVSQEAFFTASENALKSSNRQFSIIKKTGHDIDHPVTFPEGSYLKCAYYRMR